MSVHLRTFVLLLLAASSSCSQFKDAIQRTRATRMASAAFRTPIAAIGTAEHHERMYHLMTSGVPRIFWDDVRLASIS